MQVDKLTILLVLLTQSALEVLPTDPSTVKITGSEEERRPDKTEESLKQVDTRTRRRQREAEEKDARWKEVIKDVMIPLDLESAPLQIKTYDALASGNQTLVYFYDSSEEFAGYLRFKNTYDSLQYVLGRCTTSESYVTLDEGSKDEVWTITKTEEPSIRLNFNEVEVFNLLLEETCTDPEWRVYWTADVEKIMFPFTMNRNHQDKASRFYRVYGEDLQSGLPCTIVTSINT